MTKMKKIILGSAIATISLGTIIATPIIVMNNKVDNSSTNLKINKNTNNLNSDNLNLAKLSANQILENTKKIDFAKVELRIEKSIANLKISQQTKDQYLKEAMANLNYIKEGNLEKINKMVNMINSRNENLSPSQKEILLKKIEANKKIINHNMENQFAASGISTNSTPSQLSSALKDTLIASQTAAGIAAAAETATAGIEWGTFDWIQAGFSSAAAAASWAIFGLTSHTITNLNNIDSEVMNYEGYFLDSMTFFQAIKDGIGWAINWGNNITNLVNSFIPGFIASISTNTAGLFGDDGEGAPEIAVLDITLSVVGDVAGVISSVLSIVTSTT